MISTRCMSDTVNVNALISHKLKKGNLNLTHYSSPRYVQHLPQQVRNEIPLLSCGIASTQAHMMNPAMTQADPASGMGKKKLSWYSSASTWGIGASEAQVQYTAKPFA